MKTCFFAQLGARKLKARVTSRAEKQKRLPHSTWYFSRFGYLVCFRGNFSAFAGMLHVWGKNIFLSSEKCSGASKIKILRRKTFVTFPVFFPLPKVFIPFGAGCDKGAAQQEFFPLPKTCPLRRQNSKKKKQQANGNKRHKSTRRVASTKNKQKQTTTTTNQTTSNQQSTTNNQQQPSTANHPTTQQPINKNSQQINKNNTVVTNNQSTNQTKTTIK